MPWNMEKDDVDHPAYAYHCRVGQLSDSRGERVGYVIVIARTYWSRVGGRLWWRRWGNPAVGADVAFFTKNAEPDTWDLIGDDLDSALDSWAIGQLTRGNTTFSVEWLSVEAGDKVGLEVCGWDLPGQRAM
jgi:hypothetical protein